MTTISTPPVPTPVPTPWPEQLRFPGQAAAHPGPADMTLMYVMHHAFRRDLAAFAAAATATPDPGADHLAGTRVQVGAVRRHPAPPPLR